MLLKGTTVRLEKRKSGIDCPSRTLYVSTNAQGSKNGGYVPCEPKNRGYVPGGKSANRQNRGY